MSREIDTAAGRVRWAIARSGMTLEELAEKMGCTHATLSQWQRDHTDLGNAKSRLLHAFATETNTNAHWLLTGEGPAVDSYAVFSRHPLVVRAQEIAQGHAQLSEAAERVLDAMAKSMPPEPSTPPPEKTP